MVLAKDEARPKKRLMWLAPQPYAQASFSVVSKELLKRLEGYSTLYLAQHYLGEPRPEQNYMVAPYFSGNHLLHYLDAFKPDVAVLFQSPGYLTRLNPIIKMVKEKTRLILYTPIEGYPITLDIDPLFSSADLILVPSKYSQECLKKDGYDSEVLYHGVDTTIFNPAPKPKPNAFTVGSVASDVWRKQLTRIIDAHKLCLDRGHQTRLLMVTSTYDLAPWQPNLKKYAEKVSPTAWFNEAAILNIPVSQRAIANLYRQMHCHILTSTEAFGLPNLEAMASGTVPIVSPHGASPEVVGNCGIYAKVKDYLHTVMGKVALVDVEDLAEKIIWAHQHPSELNRLAIRGGERVKQFSWNTISKRLEDLLAD
jgi:glycosyltransferase involved in cell wall biosynthesis